MLVVLTACAPPGSDALRAHSEGNFESAKRQILDLEPAARDRFLVLAEQGKIALDAGDPVAAQKALTDASDWGERYSIYEPKTTIAEEAASIAINQTMRTYRGTYADRIMVDAYAALTQLWLGDSSRAAVFANRVVERQQDAEVEQQKQIDKVNREIASYRGGSMDGLVKQVRQSPPVQSAMANQGASAYLNPFASWICAMAWSASGVSSNADRARQALEQASAMVPSNATLRAQAERNPFVIAETRPQVLILFEGCRSMALRQLLIPLITPWAGFSSIPLPLPEAYGCDVAGLTIVADGASIRTELLSDNDAIFKAQYDRMLPEVIFRTAVMIAAKEAATVAAAQSQRNNSGAQIGILAGMSLYKALTNQADLRSWRSVGKFTQIAQLDRPASGCISIAVVGSSGLTGAPAMVPLPPGSVVMIYVRSMHAGATAIYAFPLTSSTTLASIDRKVGRESVGPLAVRSNP